IHCPSSPAVDLACAMHTAIITCARWSTLRPTPAPLSHLAGARPGSAPRVVAALLVDRRRPGDVEVRPRHLPDEVLQEQRRVDRATEAASRILQGGDRALDQLFHLRGKRHPPEGLAGPPRAGEQFARELLVVAEEAGGPGTERDQDG